MIWLYKERAYLRAESLKINIVENVPMIFCIFMETF